MGNERWLPIADYPSYEVSDLGRIRRVAKGTSAPAGTILSTRGLRSGYPSVDLCRDGQKRSYHVHRLVAAAFLGACPEGQVVNHLSGDRMDPRATNLEYTTQSGNVQHAYDNGFQVAHGSHNGRAKLNEEDVQLIRSSPEKSSVLAARFGVRSNTITRIRQGKGWSNVKIGAV